MGAAESVFLLKFVYDRYWINANYQRTRYSIFTLFIYSTKKAASASKLAGTAIVYIMLFSRVVSNIPRLVIFIQKFFFAVHIIFHQKLHRSRGSVGVRRPAPALLATKGSGARLITGPYGIKHLDNFSNRHNGVVALHDAGYHRKQVRPHQSRNTTGDSHQRLWAQHHAFLHELVARGHVPGARNVAALVREQTRAGAPTNRPNAVVPSK